MRHLAPRMTLPLRALPQAILLLLLLMLSIARAGWSEVLYLDAAATAPMRREALEAAWPYLTGEFGNPSSRHSLGERAAAGLTDARRQVARVLAVRVGEGPAPQWAPRATTWPSRDSRWLHHEAGTW